MRNYVQAQFVASVPYITTTTLTQSLCIISISMRKKFQFSHKFLGAIENSVRLFDNAQKTTLKGFCKKICENPKMNLSAGNVQLLH